MLVYGVTASGKTTAAARISAATGIHSPKRQRIRDWAAQPGGPRVLRFTTSAAPNAWIDTLQACARAGSTGCDTP